MANLGDEESETIPETGEVEQASYDDVDDYNETVYDFQQEQQFGNYLGQKVKDSIFGFFNNVLGLKNSTKVANLDKRELGAPDISVRSCENLSKLGELLHNKSYQDYFRSKSEVVLATSMSKKGWLPELVVSQKRFTQRNVQPMLASVQKKGLFNKSSPPTEQTNEQS